MKLYQRLALGVTLAAAGLRFFRLGSQSLWFDEAARLAMASADLAAVLTNAGGDTLPPFFHLTQHAWLALLGLNDYLARFLPAVAGVLLVAVSYRLGRVLYNPRTGLLAAALAALMPYQVYQSQEANLYALVALLSGLQMWFFWQALQSNRWRWWTLFAASALVGLYTHYFTIFTLAALHLFALVYARRYGRAWPRLLAGDVLVGLAFLPQLANLLSATGQVFTGFWLGKPGWPAPLAALHFFLLSYSLPLELAGPALFVTFGLLSLALLEVGLQSRRQRGGRELLYLLLLLFLPLLLVFAIAQLKPIFLERSLVIVVPALAVLLGRAAAASRWRSPLPYFYLALNGLMLVSLYHYYFDPTYAKPPLRQAASHVAGHFQAGDVVVHTGNGSYLPFLFYDLPAEHYLLAGDPAPHHPAQVFRLAGGREIDGQKLAGYRRIWLVIELDHSIDYQLDQVSRFDHRFASLAEANFGGIFVKLYQPGEVSR